MKLLKPSMCCKMFMFSLNKSHSADKLKFNTSLAFTRSYLVNHFFPPMCKYSGGFPATKPICDIL